jgi:MFS transporter, ENTS family, enterobactin (siderophore) exporter
VSRGLLVDITPLRESRDFRLIWLSQLATTAGRQVVLVAVPYQVYVVTHSSLAVGLLGLFQAVPIVVAGLYGGALADRFDRRRLQLIGKSLVAAASTALAIGAAVQRTPVWSIYLIVALSAAAAVIDQSARAATIPRLVSSSSIRIVIEPDPVPVRRDYWASLGGRTTRSRQHKLGLRL